MAEQPEEPKSNPMNHREEPSNGVDGPPKFGRLLIVLVLTLILLGFLTWGTEAFHS